jgi:cytochrome P450
MMVKMRGTGATIMSSAELVPYLDLADPNFSVRSSSVRDARDNSWYARTPYGLAVLRYQEVGELLRDPRLRQGSHKWPAHNQATGSFADWWLRMLLNRMGADHARLRRLVNPAFSPKLIPALQPRFEEIANELIDGFAKEGRCEFMADFSEPYAARVVCTLLGLPDNDWRDLATTVGRMGLALGVTYHAEEEMVNRATDRLFDYSRQLIRERRKASVNDLLGLLLEANKDKDALSDEELEDMVVLAIFGGIDTTRNQIGLAMSQFIEHPDQWRLIAQSPELARVAVEEVMRTRPTTTWVTREALEDFTYNGVEFKEGTTIHLFTESAGTDPSVFAPGFDITVNRRQHYGFGGGIHHCLGAFIARGDMAEALKLLARRIRNPAYEGGPVWLPDSGNTGPIKLPIKFDPETRASTEDTDNAFNPKSADGC